MKDVKTIKVDIKTRIEWLSKRITLEPYQKDYIEIQIKDAVNQAVSQMKDYGIKR
ncbi:MAG: hypothetical protein HRU26_17075 [Psychroserpens sp.]|nr:hypothetical protein [Psychroserpens sp.]